MQTKYFLCISINVREKASMDEGLDSNYQLIGLCVIREACDI